MAPGAARVDYFDGKYYRWILNVVVHKLGRTMVDTSTTHTRLGMEPKRLFEKWMSVGTANSVIAERVLPYLKKEKEKE